MLDLDRSSTLMRNLSAGVLILYSGQAQINLREDA